MTRERSRRISPSMIVAVVALVLAVSGTAVAGALINGASIKNRSIPGTKLKAASIIGAHVKNRSLPGTKLRNNSVTGVQVNESTLVGLQPGTFVSRKLALNENVELIRNGPLALTARCVSQGGDDVVEVFASTTLPGSMLEGFDELPGFPMGTLEPTTPELQREFMSNSVPAGQANVDSDTDEGFVLAPDGSRISVIGDTALLGLNYLGAKCFVAFYAVSDRIT